MTVLLSEEEVRVAARALRSRGMKTHPTEWKNWDLWYMTEVALGLPRDARILDVGCAGSPFLSNLAEQGYTDLTGIDFSFSGKREFPEDKVKYETGDLTNTRFPFEHFDLVTSLSVIEHGVNPASYVEEMSRILKPGGLLLTSTDFWPERVSTWNVPKRKTFGTEWKVMTVQDILDIVLMASRWGLELDSGIDFRVKDKVVRWEGKEYTFIRFALRKREVVLN